MLEDTDRSKSHHDDIFVPGLSNIDDTWGHNAVVIVSAHSWWKYATGPDGIE